MQVLPQEGEIFIQDAASFVGKDGRCPRCGAVYCVEEKLCEFDPETGAYDVRGIRYRCVECQTLRPTSVIVSKAKAVQAENWKNLIAESQKKDEERQAAKKK